MRENVTTTVTTTGRLVGRERERERERRVRIKLRIIGKTGDAGLFRRDVSRTGARVRAGRIISPAVQ